MNRFTKDMATIDDMLPLVLFDLIQVFKNSNKALPEVPTFILTVFSPPLQMSHQSIIKTIRLACFTFKFYLCITFVAREDTMRALLSVCTSLSNQL